MGAGKYRLPLLHMNSGGGAGSVSPSPHGWDWSLPSRETPVVDRHSCLSVCLSTPTNRSSAGCSAQSAQPSATRSLRDREKPLIRTAHRLTGSVELVLWRTAGNLELSQGLRFSGDSVSKHFKLFRNVCLNFEDGPRRADITTRLVPRSQKDPRSWVR